MSTESERNTVYLLTISILPQKDGLDVPHLLREISNVLVDHQRATKVLMKIKIIGEAKVIAFIQVSDIAGLERTVAGLWVLGPVDVDSQPVVPYESFAKKIHIADELCNCSRPALRKDGFYFLEVIIEYHGHSYDEFLAIWKKEAETVLSLRSKGEVNLELFKSLGQRRVFLLLTTTDPAQLDHLTLELPIVKDNGANIQMKSKGLQFLDDYISQM